MLTLIDGYVMVDALAGGHNRGAAGKRRWNIPHPLPDTGRGLK